MLRRHIRNHLFSTCFLVLLLMNFPSQAADYDYSADSWAEHGITLTREHTGGLELSFSVNQWSLGAIAIDGRQLQTIQTPGVFLPNDAGAPNLPGLSRWIAIPRGATASISIVDSRTERYSDIDIAPAPRLPLETEDGLEYPLNNSIYGRDAMYPEQPIKLSTPTEIRGVGAILVGICPFQYNPVTRELIVYRDLKLEVTFSGGDGQFGEDRLRNRWWDPILQQTFLNQASLPAIDYQTRERARIAGPDRPGSRTPDFEYLIMCQNDPVFVAWADSLRTFRNEQGIRTGVVTLDEIGGNTTTAIESYINDAYAWDIPPVAVLLLGDYGTSTSGVNSPIYDSYCKSDNIYADVNNNHMPDIIFARIAANNEQQLINTVGKGLDYERQPPTNRGFYDNPVIAGGWQTERWFILCDEVLHGFMANSLNKFPVREYAIYSGSPGGAWSTATNTGTVVDYFGPNGLGYIPANSAMLNDWGGNATRINADINAGSFIVQHRDHGNVDGWGEPSYNNSSLNGLNNTDLPFVFSINCLTGKFDDGSECFAEAFHRYPQRAVGLIAATEISYSFVNDTYIWGMYDFMWPDFMPDYGPTGSPEWGDPNAHRMLPAFANAAGKYFLQGSSWPFNYYDKEVTYYLFHHHGDAFLNVYSEMPQPLTVTHAGSQLSGVEYFTVTADQGALVGIAADGDYLGSIVATGFAQNIATPAQLPGGNITVTVTKQNFYRYRQEVPVVPPEGPYLIYSSCTILDADGDDDGQLDEDEDAGLEITLHNVGIELATNVSAVLSSEDPFVTVVDTESGFPDIGADQLETSMTPFSVQVSGAVPDGHVIPFQIVATADQDSWVSSFSLTAEAPVLALNGDIRITDDQANANGVAEPGEILSFEIGMLNVGHSDATNLTAVLTSSDVNMDVLSGMVSCETMPAGDAGVTGGFVVDIHETCPSPSTIACQLVISTPTGYQATFDVYLPVGGWYDTMETDLGWTAGVAGDDATAGLWTRTDPVGTSYSGFTIQMENDHTVAPGTQCWVTGNTEPGGTAGANDVDGGTTTLLTPVFDLSDAVSATVSYWRWYTNSHGNSPDEDWWDVEVTDDGVNWMSLEHTQTTLAAWTQMTFDLSEFVTLTNRVQIRFLADDSGAGGSLVEAGVDDFLLTAYRQLATPVEDNSNGLPARAVLGAAYPNPFNPRTTINFALPQAGHTSLDVYDVAGRLVRTLIHGEVAAGHHEAVWLGKDNQGRRMASGVYYYRLITDGFSATRKMVLLK